jgi:type VI secretion system secreted protein Hcp
LERWRRAFISRQDRALAFEGFNMADMFLKMSGVRGESLDARHKDEIEIAHWGWGLKNSATFAMTDDQSVKQGTADNVTITKKFDRASVTLARYCATGQHIGKATITCRKNAGEGAKVEFMVVELMKVMVTNVRYESKGDVEEEPETITLSFSQFKIKYVIQQSDGTGGPGNEFGFDLATHTPV